MFEILNKIALQQRIVIPLILISVFIGVFYYNELKKSPEKYILILLIFSLLIELIAIYIGYIVKANNFYIYNVFTNISFLIYLFYYYLKTQKPKFFKYLVLIFVLSIIISITVENFIKELQIINFIVGSIIVLVCTLYYFMYLLKSEEIFNIKTNRGIYISSGLLIFYLGIIPLVLLSKYFESEGELTSEVANYIGTTVIILNILLYSFIILGFICKKMKK